MADKGYRRLALLAWQALEPENGRGYKAAASVDGAGSDFGAGAGVGAGAHARCELDGGAEEVVALGDRFAGVDADADVHLARRVAVVVMSEAALKDSGADAQARIVDFEVVGVAPEIMGIGPVPAVQSLLARNKITLDEIDLVELNEAFAAQVIACDRELHFDADRLNVNGGAIALGHPIGCSGARIVVTLMHEMARRKARYGIAALCVLLFVHLLGQPFTVWAF